jgi:NtrC-family two-component system sensor histidine kinase KinB
LKPQAAEKSIELSSHLANGVTSIKADYNKVMWILTNLISNALRYTNSDGHIRLSAEQAGQQVSLSVSDDGRGIPYEYQSKIFEKFIQVKGDKHPGSTGLGLAICKEIVRAHGGTIWVDSTPGAGSTFTFTIPAAE